MAEAGATSGPEPSAEAPLGIGLPALVAAAVTLVAFLPALRGGFVLWDDPQTIVHNPHIRSFDADHLRAMFFDTRMGHYHPLTWLSFAIDYAIWGLDPVGFKLTSIVIHAANAGLVTALAFAVLDLSGVDARRARLAAAIGALTWALHPLRVESVAWATERRDVLSTLGLLAAVLCYLRAHRARLCGRRAAGWLAAAVLAHAFSLGAKAWGLTLPAVLLVLDAWLGRLGRLGGLGGVGAVGAMGAVGAGGAGGAPSPRRERLALVLLEKVPFAILAAAAGAMAIHAQREVGALSGVGSYGIESRAAQAIYGLAFYLEKTLVPLDLAPLYERWYGATPWRRVAPRAVGLLVLVGAAIALRRRAPALPFALTAYAVLVSPVLGAAQSGPQLVADRYSYVAAIPLAVLVAAAFARWRGREGAAVLSRPLLALTAAVLVGLASAAIRQMGYWRMSVLLWARVVQVDPTSARGWIVLGHTLRSEGELAGGEQAYRRATEARSDSWLAWLNLARVDPTARQRALEAIEAALASAPLDAQLHLFRAEVLAALGARAEALGEIERAIEVQPGHAGAHFERGLARGQRGDLRGAIADYDRALVLSGGLPIQIPAVLSARASARARLGDAEGALADVERALALEPDHVLALVNRAEVLRDLGRPAEARRDLDRACASREPPPEAFAARGELRREQGDLPGARVDLVRAIELADPAWTHRSAVEEALAEVDEELAPR